MQNNIHCISNCLLSRKEISEVSRGRNKGGSGCQNFLRAIPGKNVGGGPRVDFYTKMYYDFEFKLYGWWVL